MDINHENNLELILRTLQSTTGKMGVNTLFLGVCRDLSSDADISHLLQRLQQMGYVNFKNRDEYVSLTEKGYKFHNFASERYDQWLEDGQKEIMHELEISSKRIDLEMKSLTISNLKLKNRRLRWTLFFSVVGFLSILFKNEIYQFLGYLLTKIIASKFLS